MTEEIGSGRGPYDIEDLADDVDLSNSHLDLGSVLVPVVEGGQVTVEMTADHQPQAVHLVTPHGRISVAAFAAPRSPGLWREVVGELVDTLRTDGAEASTEDGHWGREVVAVVPGGVHRFIGAEGPRWMVRCVASGPPESADDLAPVARAVLSESVVRRGSDPHPPRDPLPVSLPPVLAEQVFAAQQQMQADGVMDQFAAAPEELAEQTGTPPAEPTSTVTGAGADTEVAPEGAIAQSARAHVIGEDDPVGTDVHPDIEVTDAATQEPSEAEADRSRRSSGSALQRLRRRQGKK
ncbi:MAG: DUF3710 domain-containing protein [Corynebacteriales bacterium]|uniref:DUF3710 domain-containing protein n=1 Tax=Williamsia herbipolensis TaxID=1603258 RepID=A0AAU4K3E6_9NOCA|nr:DUF3710 domain-containing protein [Williamsia herbipolensis]MCX6470928.1 DUF3710 domain-containing protein [Mycobacteriales bacterium]